MRVTLTGLEPVLLKKELAFNASVSTISPQGRLPSRLRASVLTKLLQDLHLPAVLYRRN